MPLLFHYSSAQVTSDSHNTEGDDFFVGILLDLAEDNIVDHFSFKQSFLLSSSVFSTLWLFFSISFGDFNSFPDF